jgi:hypothetical protein
MVQWPQLRTGRSTMGLAKAKKRKASGPVGSSLPSSSTSTSWKKSDKSSDSKSSSGHDSKSPSSTSTSSTDERSLKKAAISNKSSTSSSGGTAANRATAVARYDADDDDDSSDDDMANEANDGVDAAEPDAASPKSVSSSRKTTTLPLASPSSSMATNNVFISHGVAPLTSPHHYSALANGMPIMASAIAAMPLPSSSSSSSYGASEATPALLPPSAVASTSSMSLHNIVHPSLTASLTSSLPSSLPLMSNGSTVMNNNTNNNNNNGGGMDSASLMRAYDQLGVGSMKFVPVVLPGSNTISYVMQHVGTNNMVTPLPSTPTSSVATTSTNVISNDASMKLESAAAPSPSTLSSSTQSTSHGALPAALEAMPAIVTRANAFPTSNNNNDSNANMNISSNTASGSLPGAVASQSTTSSLPNSLATSDDGVSPLAKRARFKGLTVEIPELRTDLMLQVIDKNDNNNGNEQQSSSSAIIKTEPSSGSIIASSNGVSSSTPSTSSSSSALSQLPTPLAPVARASVPSNTATTPSSIITNGSNTNMNSSGNATNATSGPSQVPTLPISSTSNHATNAAAAAILSSLVSPSTMSSNTYRVIGSMPPPPVAGFSSPSGLGNFRAEMARAFLTQQGQHNMNNALVASTDNKWNDVAKLHASSNGQVNISVINMAFNNNGNGNGNSSAHHQQQSMMDKGMVGSHNPNGWPISTIPASTSGRPQLSPLSWPAVRGHPLSPLISPTGIHSPSIFFSGYVNVHCHLCILYSYSMSIYLSPM